MRVAQADTSSRGEQAGAGDGGYHRPPILVGYTYEPADAYLARDQERLLSLRLETNRSCNLRCRYCYARSSPDDGRRLEADQLERIVRQAADLGARSIVVIGGGEPTLHPHFERLVGFIHSLQMVPVVFTNAVLMTRDLARSLYASNASVMVKLDSLQPSVQDHLAGRRGAFKLMQEGIANLVEAGFTRVDDPHRLRLGASFVSCRMNTGEIEEIWHYCRRGGIFPNMEVLTPTGRADQELIGQGLTTEEIQAYKLKLLQVDRACYGFDWLPHTPLTASGCLQHLYSLYVTIDGDVRPCAPTKFDEHPALRRRGVYPYNVFRATLREIHRSELFEYVRHIDAHLEGRCRRCRHLDECIGCRGYAYSVGVKAGLGPREALRGPCLQCSLQEREAT